MAPGLSALFKERPEAAALRVIANDPLPPASVRVGALVSSRNAFLRSQVDQAIDALAADGTIDALMEKHRYQGNAGE